MNILITGSEGFVGKNLVELFSKDGFFTLNPGVAEIDLTDAVQVDAYLSEHDVDVIIHSATTLRQKTEYPDDVCEMNLRMFFNLVRSMKPSTRLINFGSGSEYSRPHWKKKMREVFFNSHVPTDSHSYAKYLISKYIEENTSLDMITLRIFGIFGKYEDYRYKFISNSIAKNLLQMPIVINRNAEYDYIYIDDFYLVVKHFVLNEPLYRSVNVTPEKPVELVSIAETINEISRYKSEIQVLNEGIGIYYSGDNSRLLESFSEFSTLAIRDSVRDLFNWYESRLSSLDITLLQQDDYLEYAKKIGKGKPS